MIFSELDNKAAVMSGLNLEILDKVRTIVAHPQFSNVHDATYHVYRYTLSVQFLLENFEDINLKVLELGEPGPFTEIMQHFFKNWKIFHQFEDLREGIKFQNNFFDLVISTEVLEHIADSHIGHEITSQGVRDHLSDLYNTLKPRGKLFLTTPNASSVWLIKRILMEEPPLVYENHYREFSHRELAHMILVAGFKILKHESKIVWNFWNFEDIIEFMRNSGYNLENRGDDQFLLAQKN